MGLIVPVWLGVAFGPETRFGTSSTVRPSVQLRRFATFWLVGKSAHVLLYQETSRYPCLRHGLFLQSIGRDRAICYILM